MPRLDEGRDRAKRIDLQKGLGALFAGVDIDEALLRGEPFQIERDAHAIGRRGAPEGEELERFAGQTLDRHDDPRSIAAMG
jgi:hypothetical protein